MPFIKLLSLATLIKKGCIESIKLLAQRNIITIPKMHDAIDYSIDHECFSICSYKFFVYFESQYNPELKQIENYQLTSHLFQHVNNPSKNYKRSSTYLKKVVRLILFTMRDPKFSIVNKHGENLFHKLFKNQSTIINYREWPDLIDYLIQNIPAAARLELLRMRDKSKSKATPIDLFMKSMHQTNVAPMKGSIISIWKLFSIACNARVLHSIAVIGSYHKVPRIERWDSAERGFYWYGHDVGTEILESNRRIFVEFVWIISCIVKKMNIPYWGLFSVLNWTKLIQIPKMHKIWQDDY
jgi:hypothetical protein